MKNNFAVNYTTFEDIVEQSDVIILSCNASAENTNMINEKTINKMKPGVTLINIARGSLIDEDALRTHAQKFHFIGLDAIKDESAKGLKIRGKHSNIAITPHIAYLADSSLDIIRHTTYDIMDGKAPDSCVI